LEAAFRLTDALLAEFWDGSPDGSGGLFLSAGHAERLIVRPRPSGDGALPGAESVTLALLLKLGRIGDRREYERKAEKLLRLASDLVRRQPAGFTHLLSGLDFLLGPSYEAVIAGGPGAADTACLAGALRRAFLPNTVMLLRPDAGEAGDSGPQAVGEAGLGEPDEELLRLAPFVRDYHAGPEGQALVYVCRNYSCRLPTADPAEMLRLLEGGD
jgi:hypothetical protein